MNLHKIPIEPFGSLFACTVSIIYRDNIFNIQLYSSKKIRKQKDFEENNHEHIDG